MNQNNEQTRAQKEGTSWLKIVGIIIAVIVGIFIILAVLSSVVLSSLMGAREASRDARRQTDLNQLQTSVELYENENDKYPESLSALENSNAMTRVPDDPQTDEQYKYTVTDDEARYCLGACMEEEGLPNDNSQQCIEQLSLSCEGGTPYAIEGTQ